MSDTLVLNWNSHNLLWIRLNNGYCVSIPHGKTSEDIAKSSLVGKALLENLCKWGLGRLVRQPYKLNWQLKKFSRVKSVR